MKTILVTGGCGFLGEALIPRLKGKIRVLDRDEKTLVKLKEKYPQIEIVAGDISQEWIVKKAMKGCDEIQHLSAFKHVGLAEENVFECIQSNIIGSLNILSESLNTKPKLVIGISTDKAAQVKGIYGATKMCMEGLFREAEQMNTDTKYRIVRYGNVLWSTGSVLCKWKDAIETGRPIVVTNPESTRFYWTREQAIDHIFDCIKKSKDTTPYVPKMKSIMLRDLAEAFVEKYGKNTKIVLTKLENCDNVNETVDGVIFSNQVERYTKNEIMKLI